MSKDVPVKVGASSTRMVTRLVGVYDADHTIRGELSYWIGARVGRRHCGLCEITHGLVRERADWRSSIGDLGIPFVTYHRDDQPQSVRDEAEGRTPVIVAETPTGPVLLLKPSDIEACAGSPQRLVAEIHRVLGANGLSIGSR